MNERAKWLNDIVRPIFHRATPGRQAQPHPSLFSLLSSGASGGTLSAKDWLDDPSVATSPDERPPVQAAAASSLTTVEVKDPTTQCGPSREDSWNSFAGVSKWEMWVRPEPPAMGETSAERSAFVAFTKEFLRVEFTDEEIASMLELG